MKNPTDIADLLNSYFDAYEEFQKWKEILRQRHDTIIRRCAPGRYKHYNVIQVRATKVQSYVRRGYTVVRWKRGAQ